MRQIRSEVLLGDSDSACLVMVECPYLFCAVNQPQVLHYRGCLTRTTAGTVEVSDQTHQKHNPHGNADAYNGTSVTHGLPNALPQPTAAEEPRPDEVREQRITPCRRKQRERRLLAAGSGLGRFPEFDIEDRSAIATDVRCLQNAVRKSLTAPFLIRPTILRSKLQHQSPLIGEVGAIGLAAP